MMGVRGQPKRFYDGGTPSRPGQPAMPPDPERDPRIVLDREQVAGRESFRMARRIAYRDRHAGELLVPANPDTFRTDLTSVPWLFTWLVPKTGDHLPAALLHDGLVADRGEKEPTYISTENRKISRVQADRVFRDAMADTGTPLVRRWLVWSAVATATIFLGSADWSRFLLWRYRVTAALTVLLVIYLGLCATADLFDHRVTGLFTLPWMAQRPWWAELLGGAAGAIAIPAMLGLTWGRFRIAGTIAGVGTAFLLHVTVALLLLTGLYQVVERLVRTLPWAAAGLAVILTAAAFVWVGLGLAG